MAVRQKGRLLQHCSPILRGDKEVVLAAVRQSGLALLHAAAPLRRSLEVVLSAVRQCLGTATWAQRLSEP